MGLIQRRLGFRPLELFAAALRTVDVIWIDRGRHDDAEAVLFRSRRWGVNVVDAASFATMRALGLDTAFAFDDDYAREGFRVLEPVTVVLP
jgi:predicted nucleic acid-binding protein